MTTENTAPKTGKFALNYGILLGVATIIFSLMLFMADLQYDQSWVIFTVNLLIMAGVIVFGQFKFREANGGLMNFSEALKVGVGIALIGAILGVLYQMIFMNFIEPDFMENIMAIRKQEMIAENPNMSKQDIENASAMMEKFSGPAISAAFGLIGGIFLGLIISLISGLVLKKQAASY